MPNISDNQDNITDVNEQHKESQKRNRKANTEAKKQSKKADACAGVEDWLADTPLYYIGQLDRFVVQDELGGWAFLKSSALPRIYPILNDFEAIDALPTAMEEAERAFLYCTYAFKEYPQTLNLMDTSNWLKPKAGQHHWAFDVLMRSLGSGKAANVEHIQRVLTYKYLHPDFWRLPCLLFFGEGGVGKNLLVDLVLYTIFNSRTISATSDNLVSTFNSLLKGMLAVLINETVVGKHDNAKLTNLLNKDRIEINEKGVPQYRVDNTPLYLIGSNDWNGGALLDRSDADRRLSVMRCERGKTLKYWLAQHMGVNEHEANEWLKNEGGKIFGDPDEIAKWLHHLIETFGTCDMPDALHGADYDGLMDIQEQTDERIARAVFMAEDFDYIGVKDLYEGYLCCCKETGNRFPVKDKTFNRRIELWLEGNLPTVVKQTHKQNYYLPGSTFRDPKTRKQREKTVWINPAKSCNLGENSRDKYFYDEGPTPPKWKLEI